MLGSDTGPTGELQKVCLSDGGAMKSFYPMKQWRALGLLGLLAQRFCVSFTIEPGTGLISAKNTSNKNHVVERVLIFEHTSQGTGGLVPHQPTPIRLKDLSIPAFAAFAENPIMLGCGTDSPSAGGSSNSNVPLSDMAPWFWIHNVVGLEGSSKLTGARSPLFMGGNIAKASDLISDGTIEPSQFKFFWKYKSWPADQLMKDIEAGKWICQPQDPEEALRPGNTF